MTLAAIYGSFKVSRNTQATTLYRDNALAWEAKAKIQEGEITDLKEKVLERDNKISKLEAAVAVLQDTVTGKVALDAIALQVGSIVDIQNRILTAIEDNHRAISEVRAKLN